jgi:hypothetical protein
MARCIICVSEKRDDEFSDEHVFPEAIGGRIVVRTVCKPCNDRLGNTIDHCLTNHWLVQGQRMLLKLPGKTGQIPNPLERGVMKDDPTQKVLYKMDGNGMPKELYTVPSVQRTPKGDGTEEITIRIDKKDAAKLPDIVNKMRARAGQPPMTAEEIEAAQTASKIEKPWMSMQIAIDVVEYKRAIVKIAYELACKWLGDAFVDDPMAAQFRACLLDDDDDWASKERVRNAINLIDDKPEYPFWHDGTKSHLAFIMAVKHEIYVYVRIFELFEGKLLVTNCGDRYPGFEGMFLSNNPGTGAVREVALVEEFDRLGDDAVPH